MDYSLIIDALEIKKAKMNSYHDILTNEEIDAMISTNFKENNDIKSRNKNIKNDEKVRDEKIKELTDMYQKIKSLNIMIDHYKKIQKENSPSHK
jgi:hypothetical protein